MNFHVSAGRVHLRRVVFISWYPGVPSMSLCPGVAVCLSPARSTNGGGTRRLIPATPHRRSGGLSGGAEQHSSEASLRLSR